MNNGYEKTPTHKCNHCKDTTFIATETGFKRCECYVKDITTKRWNKFGIDPNKFKNISDYNANNSDRAKAKSEAIKYCKEFQSLGAEINICFMGQSGAGKTHLVTAIGGYLLKKDTCNDIIYMPYVEVMKELKSLALEEKLYSEKVAPYLETKFLIIDDLFKDKTKNGKLIGELKETDIKHIYPIINHRYINNLPTAFNTECTPQMLFDLDEAIAGRVLEKSRVIIFERGIHNNYRLSKFN